jgi:SAM-dependent methyltransferase
MLVGCASVITCSPVGGSFSHQEGEPASRREPDGRNIHATGGGHVDLRYGSVEHLPFGDNSFDKALAINSMQTWPDAIAGLREMRRVLRPGGRIALGFTSYSGRSKESLAELLPPALRARALWRRAEDPAF